VILVGLLVALSELVGALFCLVGLFAAEALFAVAIPVVILERRRAFAAMSRSMELTRTHFWHVLGLIMTASLLSALLNVTLAAALDRWSSSGASSTTIVVAQGLVNTIASLITVPFVSTAIVALYFDLRIRDEAFDVQLAMA